MGISSNIKLEKNEYKKLSLSLKERVEKSENSIDIEKCIRKMTLNFNLLKRNICEHNVLDLSSELKHKYSILPNEVAYLKSRFLDINKKTCDEIDEI